MTLPQDSHHLDEATLERIYTRRIRPDMLDRVPTSGKPTAVLVGAQPGAGRSFVASLTHVELGRSIGKAASLSADELREYHAYWRAHGTADPQAVVLTQADVSNWYGRLTDGAIARQTNIVFEVGMRQPHGILALCAKLHDAGYGVHAVIVAADKEASRMATLVRYDSARAAGDIPRFVSAALHDEAYDRLRDTLDRVEATAAVDSLRIVTRTGQAVYSNKLEDEKWQRSPHSLQYLDAIRERVLTARELADNALRWETLVQRLAGDATVPREVAAQTLMWRNESTARAERDTEAAQLLTWSREAESFRSMNRYQFEREFPHQARAAALLDLALAEAEKYPREDAARFVEAARARISERIERGELIDRTPELNHDREHQDYTR